MSHVVKWGLVALAFLLMPSAATAQEKVLLERALTAPANWWQYTNVTPQQLGTALNQTKARIVDLEVNGVSPLKLSAALVANSGPYASGWWWYHGLTGEALSARLTEHKARLLVLEPYRDGGQLRFAAVMVPNTGANGVAWWWYYGQTAQALGEKLRQNKARLIDLRPYAEGGQTRYAAVMVSNEGAKGTGWWWYLGLTPDQVNARLGEHKARILSIERSPSGGQRFDVVLVPNTGAGAVGWWWYVGVSSDKLLELTRRHGARPIDIVPPAGNTGYAGVMIDNGMTRTGDCGGQMQSFDNEIVGWMKQYAIPGAAAAVVKGDRLVYACAFGYADLAFGETVEPHDLFRLASIAKPITNSALRKLEADGKLAFSDKMLDRLGSAKPAEPYADSRLSDITIQHLMDHQGGWNTKTLGFDPMFHSDKVAEELKTSRPASCPDVITYMFQKKELNFTPGTGGPSVNKEDYSNLGYCILGRIIEDASGQSYDKYVQQSILKPAGIAQMRIGHSLPADRAPNEVKYYDAPFAGLANSVFPGTLKKVPWPEGGFHLAAMDAHGGWIGSALDTARYARFASPQPFTGSVWSFNGALAGTYTRVVKNGDVVVALLFNSRPAGDPPIHEPIDRALAGVSSWPAGDLWSKYGYR